jgi:type I restriction enzyme R subunit
MTENINLVAENSQSEDALEKEFISQLKNQAYEYIGIHSEDDLKANLRKSLESLNDYDFSDAEWKYFFEKEIAKTGE